VYVTIVLGLSDSFNVSVKDSRSDILHRPRVRVMLLDHNYSTHGINKGTDCLEI